MKPSGRSSAPSLCAGCGNDIDPLRAGHVAILDGAFRYFCGADCKSAYVDVSSKRVSLEALTVEPPVVTATASGRRARAEEESRPGVREQEVAPHFPAVGVEAAEEAEAEADERATARAHKGDDAHEDEPETEEPLPATLRSTAREVGRATSEAEARRADELEVVPERAAEVAPARAARGSRDGARVLARVAAVAPVVGIALGVLAFVVSLAGESGSSLRLPFALSATAFVAAHVVLRTREPADPAPWFVVGPVLVASAGAVLSLALHDPRAESHAAYVGLAAAGALLVDLLVSRARRDIFDARARIKDVLAIRVRVIRGDTTVEIDAVHVKPGEQVVVEAGEVVGVDGIVAAGEADVTPWLDSPVALAKREGDAVVAGATVVSGRLRVTATFAGPDRAWIKLHHSNAGRIDVSAPLVALARRTVERGVPIAALLVGGATYANNGGWAEVVIAASAGAYALAGFAAVAAVALAHARGHIAAQRRGIVYKDAAAFDGAARAEVAVVCSRGTILLGEPEIVAVEAVASRGADPETTPRPEETARVLSLAAGAEMASSDAFGAAILRAARARGVRPENVRSAIVHAGLGVTALASNGDKVIVGSRGFLLQEKVSVAIADARVTELEAQGRSVLLVALGDRLVGLLALQDGLRPGARAAVQKLHDARIEPVLLSGEARDTCETIARALDIEHVRPEILPGDRGAEVRALADGGRVVAAVGHPSSDDGALGAADVSVAMTAAGAAPGEWGVALASDDVRDAALALTVPRACRERAKTAALVAAAAQGLSLLGIAFGAAPPAIAPIAAVVATAAALAVVREPTTLPAVR
jgi:Cu+-exporting ATPase